MESQPQNPEFRIKAWVSPVYISRDVRLLFLKNIIFFCLKIFFTISVCR